MKSSLKAIMFYIFYILMCGGALAQAVRESTKQPIGLLVAAMAMTPVIVSICGGLPVDFMKVNFSKVRDD
jgi:surface polysaccharide O-acyltransferase-like enzyme